jgi:hypothetical protein
MTLEEIERLARDNKPLPEFTTLPDVCLYETLSALWATYRNDKLDKDTAHSRKMRIIRRYKEFAAAYDTCCAVYRERQDNIRALGTLRTDIHREEDLTARLRLCIRAISAMTGDKVFEKTELDRLEEPYNG